MDGQDTVEVERHVGLEWQENVCEVEKAMALILSALEIESDNEVRINVHQSLAIQQGFCNV